MTRFPILTLALVLIVQAISPQAIAAASETCVSQGVTYNCVTQRVETTSIHPAYENGFQGATNLSNYTPPHAEWPKEFAPGRAVPTGVHIGATYERETKLFAQGNATANLTNAAQPKYVDFVGRQTHVGAIHVLQYQVNFSPKDLMNGASDLYYRSPVKWISQNYSEHYVNILGPQGELVAAARYLENRPTIDTNDSLEQNARLYYHFTGLFFTGTLYTINEYIVTKGQPPLALAELVAYVAEGQDIAEDGRITTRLFPGTAAESIFPGTQGDPSKQFFELGHGWRFYTGMGAGGSVGLLEGNATMPTQAINIRYAPAQASLDGGGAPNANVVTVTVPLRMTTPVNVTVDVTPFRSFADRNAGTQAGTSVSYTTTVPITGTFSHKFVIDATTWSGSTGTHYYDIVVRMTLTAAGCAEASQCNYVMYPMSELALPDGSKSFHILSQTGSGKQTSHAVYAQPWADVVEGNEATPASADGSFHEGSVLLGIGIILGSVLLAAGAVALVALTAPVSIPLLLAAGAGLAASGTFLGVVTIHAGANGLAPSAIFNKEVGQLLAQWAGYAVAAAGCAGMYYAPGAYKIAAGAACAAGLVLGSQGVEGLLDFVIDIIKIVKAAVEILGLLLSDLASFLAEFLGAAAPWVRAGFVLFIILTALWFVRESLLWILNLMWPIVQQMTPKARNHHQRLEATIEAVSIPIWDSIMYYKHWRTYRGRYWRQRFGGMPQ
ncbi:MAG: hypothetical protein WDA16_06450 [Candidatus Thermoplasmatota archaeon]